MDGSHRAGKPAGNPQIPPLSPPQSSPECFVKGQASEVKEAEILLCYQLAKFITVIKEGVVSPLAREEDTVHSRNSQPNPTADTISDTGTLAPGMLLEVPTASWE